ncbi:MAG: membrane protein insertion efficiency factor YidD [Dehalococcoidia bacterium]|nr:membrane protein insertion efficiency factor YidD [Dehalococcoidia bacterium]
MLRRATSLPLLWLIRAYQVTFSGLFPNTCRYQPTCSQYMYGAVERYGPLRGSWLGLRRIGRCRPGGGNGYDPVPERQE